MIISIKDDITKDIFNGINSKAARKIPTVLWLVAQRKLDMINAAHEVIDLRIPSGNRLEALKGDLHNYFSLRINEQYRIIFKFENGNALEVQITDYHK
jgi:toxin HigB-1